LTTTAQQPPVIPSLLSARDLAARLKLSTVTIYNWTARARLPYLKIGRRVLFDPEAVNEWLAARARQPLPLKTRHHLEKRRRARSAAKKADAQVSAGGGSC